ncbi:hypothetical protein [Streptomyces candidus]|uniref:Uncharacterized protein n=1 Tax=Streptomyces candidus TaxID=67283 RepID=A0A7X0LS71_9ACTN|nr:hypothetical protein [Streptomyces candidus]MBB6439408.1 hypothetical protein [Streptomyces candidus]GHH54857.1 hypothetical protein GCM10018773_58490 [Streptomyces candidus]
MSAGTIVGRACCLSSLGTQLPASLAGDAVAIPAHLADSVQQALTVLFPHLRPVVLEELTRARTYFLTEPGQGGIWGEDVWTLDAAAWLADPHPSSRLCGDLTVWQRRPDSEDGSGVLPAMTLWHALRLAYPTFRTLAPEAPVQQSNPGGIL